MALITWTPDLSVNIAEIDSQHQKLIDMINNLYDAMRSGKGKDIIGDIVSVLVDYTKTHFGYEEKVFDQFNYPETTTHKLAHKGFVDKVVGFQNDIKAGNVSLSIDVMNFLKDWLTTHIKGTDKKYTQFFHDHGIN